MRKKNGLILPEKQKFCDLYGQYIGFGGYTPVSGVTSISKSAMYDKDNSEALVKTLSGAGTSRKTFTVGGWFYKADMLISSEARRLFQWDNGSQNADRGMVLIDNTAPDALKLLIEDASDVVTMLWTSTQLLRDIGWYHWCLTVDTTPSTPIFKLFLNGSEVTAWTKSTDTIAQDDVFAISDSGARHCWGADPHLDTGFFDGYMAECFYLDGQVITDITDVVDISTDGLYVTPKSNTAMKALTFGDHGYYLDNATAPETDASGNGNNFTNSNTVTLSTHTPTNLDMLLSPIDCNVNTTLSNGNQTQDDLSAGWRICKGSMPIPRTGKWYWEMTWSAGSSDGHLFGVCKANLNTTLAASTNADAWAWSTYGTKYTDGSSSSLGSAPTNSSKIGFKFDSDNGTFEILKDNSSQGTVATGLTYANEGDLTVYSNLYDAWVPTFHFQEDDWEYSAPTGYKALNTTNIAEETTRTASDTNKYFQTFLYEGNGEQQRVGNFQPFTDSFTVGNSALFNSASSENFSKSWGTPTNNKIFTFSTWFKLCDKDDDVVFFSSNNQAMIDIDSDNNFRFWQHDGSGFQWNLVTDLEYTDNSQWANLVVMMDTTQSTASNRTKMYLNGVQITSFSTETYVTQDATPRMNNSSYTHYIGQTGGSSNYWEGYMAETAFLDGQTLTASSFGSTDASSGRWVPKDITGLTYGDQGFLLDYSNGSDLGEDQKNSNDWTNNNTVTQTTDSPTTNLAVLNPNTGTAAPTSNGNRTVTSQGASDNMNALSTIPLTGKVYFEFQTSTLGTNCSVGLTSVPYNYDDYAGGDTGSWGWYFSGGTLYYGGAVASSAPATLANGVRGCIALDMDTGSMWTGQVSSTTITWDNSGNPETGANPITTAINTDLTWYALISGRGSSVVTAHFASADWTGSTNRPASFSALNQDNISSSDQFISAFSWIKNRDATDNHMLFDRVRGTTLDIHSNTTDAQATNVNTVQTFLAGGVQVGDDAEVNTANESYALWNWMIETTGSGTSNEDGSVNTTRTLVDTTLGLSISQFECPNDTSDFTIGHGLGVAPTFVLLKSLDDNSYNWSVFNASTMDNQDYLKLNTDATQADNGANLWGAAIPTSSVIGITANVAVLQNTTCICYAFAPSQFISIGSYEGNADTDGVFVPTINSVGVQIQPVWVLNKNIDATASWVLFDTVRNPYNICSKYFYPDTTNSEQTADALDIVTGGFKWRNTNVLVNAANTYIYMAIGTPTIDTDGRIIGGH